MLALLFMEAIHGANVEGGSVIVYMSFSRHCLCGTWNSYCNNFIPLLCTVYGINLVQIGKQFYSVAILFSGNVYRVY